VAASETAVGAFGCVVVFSFLPKEERVGERKPLIFFGSNPLTPALLLNRRVM